MYRTDNFVLINSQPIQKSDFICWDKERMCVIACNVLFLNALHSFSIMSYYTVLNVCIYNIDTSSRTKNNSSALIKQC